MPNGPCKQTRAYNPLTYSSSTDLHAVRRFPSPTSTLGSSFNSAATVYSSVFIFSHRLPRSLTICYVDVSPPDMSFNALPNEIKEMIWDWTCFPSRSYYRPVSLWKLEAAIASPNWGSFPTPDWDVPKERFPVALHVDRVSRQCAQSVQQRENNRARRLSWEPLQYGIGSRTRPFDSHLDFLMLDWGRDDSHWYWLGFVRFLLWAPFQNAAQAFPRCRKVKYIVMPVDDLQSWFTSDGMIIDAVRDIFIELQAIAIVVNWPRCHDPTPPGSLHFRRLEIDESLQTAREIASWPAWSLEFRLVQGVAMRTSERKTLLGQFLYTEAEMCMARRVFSRPPLIFLTEPRRPTFEGAHSELVERLLKSICTPYGDCPLRNRDPSKSQWIRLCSAHFLWESSDMWPSMSSS